METKFLSDGRKVAVIGRLNNTEFIVQEIFVDENGNEVASGQQFTTQNLHNGKFISWKDKELDNIKIKIKSAENELAEMQRYVEEQRKLLRVKEEEVKRVDVITKRIGDFDWEYFCDILCGNMKWAVSATWTIEVHEIDKIIFDTEGYPNDDGLRAIKLAKCWNKKADRLEYEFSLNVYRDGSGNYTKYKFFKQKEEMEKYVISKIEEKINRMSIDDINQLEKHISIPIGLKNKIIERLNEEKIKQSNELIRNSEKILTGLIPFIEENEDCK